VVISAADVALEPRPDVLDEVGGSEDEFRMIAGLVTVAEEGVDAFVTGSGISADRAPPLYVPKDETVGRLLLAVMRHPDDDRPASPLKGAQYDLLIPEAALPEECLVDLDRARQMRAFIDQMVPEAAEPAPRGDGRDPAERAGGVEGDPSLPAYDEQIELAMRNLHPREPRDRGGAEGAAAFGAAVALLRPADVARAATRAEYALSERHPRYE